MPTIEVRALKQRASAVLRRVREDKETITVTYRGRAVARLVPVEDREYTRADTAKVWTEMETLADEIGTQWPTEATAVAAVQEQRRKL